MKKLTAIALTSAMVLSMAACGGSDKPAETTAAAAETTAAAEETTAAAEETTAAAAEAGADYSALEPVELIMGDATANGSACQQLCEALVEKVDAITGGQLTIDYHPNSELGGDVDLLRQVQSGDLDITAGQCAPAVSFIPELAVFDLPMVFAKYDGATIDKVLNGADSAFRAQINDAYEAAGYHLLGYLQNATYRLTTANTELKDLASFSGLQIRTMENSNHMAFWTAIGAEPTPLAWPEVYFALQSGTIDAQENAADTCAGANFQEVQKYLACTNHILYLNQLCMNKDSYANLDPLYQAALDQAVAEAIAEIAPKLGQIDQDNKKILTDGGMTLIEYEPSFYDEVLALDGVQALYADIDAQVNGLGTVLQEALAK